MIFFLLLTKLAYKIGYQEGYAKGYADGFRDGYAVGYQKAWAEANKIIDELKTSLEAERNGGFLGFVSKVLNTVGTVVGIIAML